jgi:hypothetical protein
MDIKDIVDEAIKTGYLTPAMEAEVGRLCETSKELSYDQYMALDKLMGALLKEEIKTIPRKQFINVMEELVLSEVIDRITEIESTKEKILDIGDVTAYALNRLPPLYATTEEGANYQRKKAKQELHDLIAEKVEKSMGIYLDRPNVNDNRHAIKNSNERFDQVNKLLQDFASNYEEKNI